MLPSKFLPEELCECLPGWSGKGAGCSECPADTYKPDLGPAACTSCKWNTTTNGNRASKSEFDCKCDKTLQEHRKGKRLSDTRPWFSCSHMFDKVFKFCTANSLDRNTWAIFRMSSKECQILLGPLLHRWNEDKVCECPEGSAIFESECLECFAPLERCRGGEISGSHCGQGSQVRTDWRSYLCALCVRVQKLWMMWNQKGLRYVLIHMNFLMPASEHETLKSKY